MELNKKKVVDLKANKTLIINAISLIDINEDNYYLLGTKSRNNIDIVKHLVELNGAHLSRLDGKFRDNEEICMIAIGNYPHAFQFASNRLKASRHFVLSAIEKVENPTFLKHLQKDLKKDHEIILALVRKNMFELAEVSEKVLQNEKFIRALLEIDFVSKHGSDCFWIYEHLMNVNHEQLINHLINLKYTAIKDKFYGDKQKEFNQQEKANKILQDNEKRKQLILDEATKQSKLEASVDFEKLEEELNQKRMNLNLNSEILNNKEFAKKMILKHSNFYQFISDDLKKDKQIAKIAILADPINLLFSPTEINENEVFIFEIAKINLETLKFANDKIKSNKDFILKFITETNNSEIVRHLNSKLKNDGDFLLDLIKVNKECEQFFTTEMIELKNKTISNKQKTLMQSKKFNILDTYKEIEEYDRLHKNK